MMKPCMFESSAENEKCTVPPSFVDAVGTSAHNLARTSSVTGYQRIRCSRVIYLVHDMLQTGTLKFNGTLSNQFENWKDNKETKIE